MRKAFHAPVIASLGGADAHLYKDIRSALLCDVISAVEARMKSYVQILREKK